MQQQAHTHAQRHRHTIVAQALLRGVGLQQALQLGALVARFNQQIARKAAARIGQAPDLGGLDAQATAEVVVLYTPLQHDKFIVLERVFGGLQRGFIDRSFQHGAFVVDLEQAQLAALAVDHTQIADDACQQLGLAAVFEFGQGRAHKAAHFFFHLVKQMSRQVKADGGFFVHQLFTHAPGQHGGQGRLLGAGALGVVAHHVEQAALVGVGQLGVGIFKGIFHRGLQRGPIAFDGIKSPGFDERLQGALVELGAVHTHTKIPQALERPLHMALWPHALAVACGHDGFNGRLPGAFDGAQPIADHVVGHRLKAVMAPVDVGRLKAQAHLQRILVQHLELVGVVHFHGHVAAEKLGGVMHLQPRRLVSQQGVSGGVRFVEAVARKLLHQVKHLIGLFLADALLGGTLTEQQAMLGHLFRLFLAHGAAQQVGAAQRVAAEHLCGLHHLLLIDHDAVGLGQHFFDQWMRVLNHLGPVLAGHEGGDQVHRAGAVQRIQSDQVFQAAGLGFAQHALHTARFKLEHRLSFTLLEQLVGGPVVQRNVFKLEVLAPLVALLNKFACNFQDGQRRQAQEVELHQTDLLHVVLVEHGHRRLAARLLVQRAKIGELARRNHHPASVHADVARHAFELLRHLDEVFNVFFLGQALGQDRLGFNGVGVLVPVFFGVGRVLERDVQSRLVRNQLGDAIAKAVAHVHHPAHIADHRARGHGAKGGNLADGVFAVFFLHVVDDAIAIGLAKIHVKVGHGDALWVQKALKQQVVVDRVQVGDLEHIRHQRTGSRAAPWPHRAAIVFRPVDEVRHDQEIARKAHLQNDGQLKLQALQVARALRIALWDFWVELCQSLFQTTQRLLAEKLLRRHAFGGGKVGQKILAQHQTHAAAARNLHGVGQGRGHIGKQLLHLRAAFEVLLARKAAWTLGIGQHLAFGNADARFVGLEVVRLQKLDGLGGNHGQLQACGQLYRVLDQCRILTAPGALQLQIKAVRKHLRQAQRLGAGGIGIATQQRLPYRPGIGTGQHHQPLAQFLQPGPCHLGLGLIFSRVFRPGTRQNFRQVVVALHRLHQYQNPAGGGIALPFHHQLGTQQGLDAFAARAFIKLETAKKVVQVGDGQRGLSICGSGL